MPVAVRATSFVTFQTSHFKGVRLPASGNIYWKSFSVYKHENFAVYKGPENDTIAK